MEMIDRYIYAVIQRLPHKQREDIAKELRGLIEDMVEERIQSDNPTEKVVENVLMELGHPKQLAYKYRGTKNYLIGPDLFDPCFSVLKISMLALSIAMGIGFAIETIINPTAILEYFIELIVSLVTVLPLTFGWVTIIFFVLELCGISNIGDYTPDKMWKPSDLPAIPNPKAEIKRIDPIVGIVFYVLVMILFSSDNFGVHTFNDGGHFVVPFLNKASFSAYLPFIILILGLSISKECVKLISGKWSKKLVLLTLFINVISTIAVLFMITGPAFWNPNFMTELTQTGIVTVGSEGYFVIKEIWNHTTRLILIFLLLGLIFDVASGFIKSRKV